jgi:hypothetical protein
MTNLRLMLAGVALASWPAAPLASPPAATPATTPAADRDTFQIATSEDMRVFDPYIGRFQSKTFTDDTGGTSFHYVVEYAWFDSGHRIVRFTVKTVLPDAGREIPGGEGFYGFDPFNARLYAFGFFPGGVTGFGAVAEFDLETHRRVTRARSQGPDGVATEVRDEFEVVDADTWKNRTSVRRAGGEWQVVYEDTFKRVDPGS